ncbi:MAG: tRNA glutamyl-Q(34) synthetase GluQRS [Steroidobacteraceae bacterium]
MTPAYRGRFAPSPTGLLHQGSLLAAVASWLDARVHGGRWLIRMEDLDTARVVPGAADALLATLTRFGLETDEPVLYQSTRAAAYSAALRRLADQGLAYRCRCSRTEAPGPYPGTCRDLHITDEHCAWRLRMDGTPTLAVDDVIQGRITWNAAALGDPVLFRRDGIASYQLAVVVDDAFQRITHVVRGADLLGSTAWQIAVGMALGVALPRYAHIPVLTEPDGTKLAKANRSLPIAGLAVVPTLRHTLQLLGLPMEQLPFDDSVHDILVAAMQHWRPGRLTGVLDTRLSPQGAAECAQGTGSSL